MIDIHCHLLYGVDDGADSIELSIAMLEDAKRQGIDRMILTPHFRHGMFRYPLEPIDRHFASLLPEAERIGIDIKLGCEYHTASDLIENCRSGRVHTMADTPYVLTEYSYRDDYDLFLRVTKDELLNGYRPIIAHVERYAALLEDPSRCAELQEIGAMIQCNADAVLGKDGLGPKRFCRKLIHNGWVDIIASDSHDLRKRANHMAECYEYVSRKFGEQTAELLMETNPAKVIDNK